MLDTIKQAIENLPDEDFESYYIKYVASIQDSILDKETSKMRSTIFNSSNIHIPEKVMNMITEELSHAQFS